MLRHLRLCALALCLLPATALRAEDPPARHTPPAWLETEVAFLTRDGGRWVASNAAYQSENEPFEAYVLEWAKGYANSMTGRLFALQDGEATGDFWRFRQYWDPARQEVVLMQFGAGGAVGIGPMRREGETTVIEQTFYAPDGGASLTGHRSENPDADTHVTESFTIVDGAWRADRKYEWRRQPPGAASE